VCVCAPVVPHTYVNARLSEPSKTINSDSPTVREIAVFSEAKVMTSTEEKALRKELGRRRVYIFFAAFYALALAGLIGEEGDIFIHALDEIVIVALSILVLVLIFIWRKRITVGELRKQHNIITVLFAIALIFKLYAFIVEANDPQDFGDEIPIAIGLVLTLLNRFL